MLSATATLGVRFPIVEHPALLHPTGSLAIDTSADAPRFDPGDEALEHLRREGYVVVRGVLANASELAHARELLWEFLEGAGVGVRRDAPETWVRSRPNQYGIVWEHGVGQSRLMWFLRTRPRVRAVFERIWQTKDLITSFDGCALFRPWLPPHGDPAWRTQGGWWHVDQNPLLRPDFDCVQGLVNLLPMSRATGGNVLIPRSHSTAFPRLVTDHPAAVAHCCESGDDFMPIPPGDAVLQ